MTVSSAKIFRLSASRPAAATSARIASVSFFAVSGLVARTNIASAWRAANWRPRALAPAWKITGVRCGEGSHRWKPGTLK